MSRLRTALTGALLLPALLALVAPSSQAAEPEAVMRLLDQKRCEGCRLQDADLVQADLRDARLQGAQLQRANLSGARLDGADLRGADLSFTSLAGASLRGANLQGSRLEGTDLRQSDLSGALVLPNSLGKSHWQEAKGVPVNSLSYAELHNAGVEATLADRHAEAERWFNLAISRMPNAAVSWTARAMTRIEQGEITGAVADLDYAKRLYNEAGEISQATAMAAAIKQIQNTQTNTKSGNNLGMQLTSGALSTLKTIAPLAMKFLLPLAL